MFAKVFASLWQGSMVAQPDAQLVFVYLLAHSDRDGNVDQTHEVIAALTGIPLDRVRAAVATLEAPDPRSRSANEDGRRIARLDEHRDWGWRIVNHAAYRALRNEEQRREEARDRMRRRRAGDRPEESTGEGELFAPVRHGSPSFADADAEAEGRGNDPSSLRSEGSPEPVPGEARREPLEAPTLRQPGAGARPGGKTPPEPEATYCGAVGGLRGLPVAGGGDWCPTPEQVEAWRAAFPGVSIEREWAAMRSWLLSNPTRAKTRRGLPAFVNNWLGRTQDRATGAPAARAGHRGGSDSRYLEQNRRAIGGQKGE